MLPAGRVDGRATAAVVHLAPLVIAFPPLSLLVNLAAQRDRRPLVRQAVRDVRRFDLVIVALVAVVLVLLLTDHATGFAVGLLTVTAAVFVVSHVIGAVQALRGRDFTYPLPPRLPRHRAPA